MQNAAYNMRGGYAEVDTGLCPVREKECPSQEGSVIMDMVVLFYPFGHSSTSLAV